MKDKPTYQVTNQDEHEALLKKVDALMKIGQANTTKEEEAHIRAMGEALMAYEQSIYTISAPTTLEGMIELRMYEMKLKQKDLAETLGITPVKLSMIINGKQKPDIAFIKAIYHKLKVPAEFILENI